MSLHHIIASMHYIAVGGVGGVQCLGKWEDVGWGWTSPDGLLNLLN